MSHHRIERNSKMLTIVAATSAMFLLAGCGTSSASKTPSAPADIPSGTLTAFTSNYGYVYIDNEWKMLSASASSNTPSDPFKELTFSPNGQMTVSTVGSDDNSFMGNQIELWTYDKAWKEFEVNGDKTIADFAWSPANVLYAVPNDEKTNGVWYQSGQTWKNIPGSASLGFIGSIQFSPKSTLTVTSQATDGSVVISQYQNHAWQRLNSVHVPFAADGIQLKWSPNGVLTVMTSAHGVWQDENGVWKQAGNIKSPIQDVAQVGWSPDGKLVISGDSSHARGIWMLDNGQWSEIGGTNAPIAKDGIRQFAWSPKGTLTISDTSTGQIDQFQSNHWVSLWKPTSRATVVPPAFAWSPKGVLTMNGGASGGLWSYQNGQWSEIGGSTSPLHAQPSIVFHWSP